MTNRIHAGAGIIRAGAAVALLSLALAGCDTNRVLSVTDPDVANPSSLSGATALPTLRAGALGDFGNAYNGPNSDIEQVDLAALFTDEFINTETFPTRIEIDQRAITITNGSLSGTYYDLNRARASADRAIAAYAANAKTASDSTGLGEVIALSGMTYVLYAENYCGAVAVSTQNPDGSITFGQPLSTTQLLDSAIARFDRALKLTGAALPTNIKYLAQVGKGRALLDRGTDSFAAAAAAVAGVPTTFQYTYQHSETSSRQNNGTYGLTVVVGRFGEADSDGGNGLPFQSEGNLKKASYDPRVADSVRTTNGGKGFDNSTTQWIQTKYPARSSPSFIADGVEARLIEAEAALQAGDATGSLAILNALRSNTSLLALRGYPAGQLVPLADAGATGARLDQLFKERAYWLFLTSHRLGDMRRLIRQYGRGAETVFPTGPYFKGGTYGTDVNIPVPQEEQNNPNFKASACNQKQA